MTDFNSYKKTPFETLKDYLEELKIKGAERDAERLNYLSDYCERVHQQIVEYNVKSKEIVIKGLEDIENLRKQHNEDIKNMLNAFTNPNS